MIGKPSITSGPESGVFTLHSGSSLFVSQSHTRIEEGIILFLSFQSSTYTNNKKCTNKHNNAWSLTGQ